jgi:hypothetical protein
MGSMPSGGNTNNFQEYTRDQILKLHDELEGQAKSMADHTDNEIIEMAATSKNFKLRICAAWALGIKKEVNEILFNLLTDEHELVVYAAKQSCADICYKKYGKALDFGPPCGSTHEEKADAREMWERLFKKYEKNPPINRSIDVITKPPKVKSPQEILNIE